MLGLVKSLQTTHRSCARLGQVIADYSSQCSLLHILLSVDDKQRNPSLTIAVLKPTLVSAGILVPSPAL